jgi:hypothetical protein
MVGVRLKVRVRARLGVLGLHGHLAAAVTAADQVLRVRLVVEVDHEQVAAWQATWGRG